MIQTPSNDPILTIDLDLHFGIEGKVEIRKTEGGLTVTSFHNGVVKQMVVATPAEENVRENDPDTF